MNVDFNGFKEESVTFECDSTVAKGSLVKVISNGKVAACSDGNNFIGIVQNVSDDICCVQLSGFVEISNTGDVDVGYQKLSASASNSVKDNDSSGREYLVIYSQNNSVGFIL